MSINVIDTERMSVVEWADFMVPNLEKLGNLGRLDDEKNWREWAVQLLNLPSISGSVVPNPYDYDDWRIWAQRFNQNISEMP